MRTCLHIVKTAEPECSSICEIILGLARHACSYSYAVSVLFLNDGPLISVMHNANVPACAISWTGNTTDLHGAYQLWRWLRKHPAEVVHFHHGGRMARIIAHCAGVRAVVRHVHGRIVESSHSVTTSIQMPFADGVIACSQAVADSIAGDRTEVIFSGIEIGVQPPPSPSQNGPLKIGVLSRLIPLKNVEAVIEATAQLIHNKVNVTLEIAGTGPSEPMLRKLVTRLGLNENVSFLGWRQDVMPLLASWDLLAMPSVDEGLPIAALQAMAAARPVVASRVGGLRELVADGVTGRLFPSGDVDALASCIADLAKDRGLLASMGIAGWQRAGQKFSAASMAKQTFDVYDRLLR